MIPSAADTKIKKKEKEISAAIEGIDHEPQEAQEEKVRRARRPRPSFLLNSYYEEIQRKDGGLGLNLLFHGALFSFFIFLLDFMRLAG